MQETDNPSRKIDKKYLKISRLKRRLLKHVWFVRGMLVGAVLISLYLIILLFSAVFGNSQLGTYLTAAKDFITTPEAKIESINGRTNILILGRGGEEHETPDITDTIIFVSVSHTRSGVSLISLPRDIWIPEIRAKINSAYYWGNQKEEGGGIVLAKSAVEEIVGEPVHYALIIDFSGFKEVIDVLGGVEVDVEESFIDEKYPIPGKETAKCDGDPEFDCRYETLSFEKGPQLMDGERALKFVRSRNAEGDQGTDIARARRQQIVISAIKSKIFSPSTLLSPRKLSNLLRVAREVTQTDIDTSAGAILLRRLLQAKDSINSYVLDGELLINPPTSSRYDNLYVFIPKEEDWGEVHTWVKSILP